MRIRELSGLRVSEIGFGAWAIGGGLAYGPVRDEESVAAIRRALDLGVTFFDTAEMYGKGHSEELLGGTLPKDAVVSSKVWREFSRAKQACEETLRRLRRDVLDIYLLHNPTVSDLDALDLLAQLRKEGKVRRIGVSIATPVETRAALERGAEVVQLVYNYLEREQRPLLGPNVIAREPIARGLLSGKYGPDSTFPDTDIRSRATRDVYLRKLREVDEFREVKHPSLTMVQAAVKFVLAEGVVAIPGMKTPAQVEEICAAADGRYAMSDIFQDGGGDA